MENRGSKGMALAALIVGVVGLTIGFAAFADTLTISNTQASYTAQESSFETAFGFTTVAAGTVSDVKENTTVIQGKTDLNVAVGSCGAIDSTDNDKWENISVAFTGVNQVAVCKATITNSSPYPAYEGTIVGGTVKSCAGGTGNENTTLVTEACKGVSMTVEATDTIEAGGTGTAVVIITGPTSHVDGSLAVAFNDVTINYSTDA